MHYDYLLRAPHLLTDHGLATEYQYLDIVRLG